MSDTFGSFGKMFGIGCGDNSCTFGNRGGMATNGGCRCYEYRSYQKTEGGLQKHLEMKGGISLLRQLIKLPSVEAGLREIVRLVVEKHERDRAASQDEEGRLPPEADQT